MRELHKDDLQKFKEVQKIRQLDSDFHLDNLDSQTTRRSGLEKYRIAENMVCEYLHNDPVDLGCPDHCDLLVLSLRYVLSDEQGKCKSLDISEQAKILSLMSCSINMENRARTLTKSLDELKCNAIKVGQIGLELMDLPFIVKAAVAGVSIGMDIKNSHAQLHPGLDKEVLESYFSKDLFSSEHFLNCQLTLSETGKNHVMQCIGLNIAEHDSSLREAFAAYQEIKHELSELSNDVNKNLQIISNSKEKLADPDRMSSIKILSSTQALANNVFDFMQTRHNAQQHEQEKLALKQRLENIYADHKLTLDLRACTYANLPTIQINLAHQFNAFVHQNVLRQEQFFKGLAQKIEILKKQTAILERQSDNTHVKKDQICKKQLDYVNKIKSIKEKDVMAYTKAALGIAATLSMANPIASGIFCLGSAVTNCVINDKQRRIEKKNNRHTQKIDELAKQLSILDHDDQQCSGAIRRNRDEIAKIEHFIFEHETDRDPELKRERLNKELTVLQAEHRSMVQELEKDKAEIKDLKEKKAYYERQRAQPIKNRVNIGKHKPTDRQLDNFIEYSSEKIKKIEKKSHLTLGEIEYKESMIKDLQFEIARENNPHLKAAKDFSYHRRKQLAEQQIEGLSEEQKQLRMCLLDAHEISIADYQYELTIRQYRVDAWRGFINALTRVSDSVEPLSHRPQQMMMLAETGYELYVSGELIYNHVWDKFKAHVKNPSSLAAWFEALKEDHICTSEFLKELVNPSINILANILALVARFACQKKSNTEILFSVLNQMGKYLSDRFQSIDHQMSEIKTDLTVLQDTVTRGFRELKHDIRHNQSNLHTTLKYMLHTEQNRADQQGVLYVNDYVRARSAEICRIWEISSKIEAHESLNENLFKQYFSQLVLLVKNTAKIPQFILPPRYSIMTGDPKYFIYNIAKCLNANEDLEVYCIPEIIAALQIMEKLFVKVQTSQQPLVHDVTKELQDIQVIVKGLISFLENLATNQEPLIDCVETIHDCYRKMADFISQRQLAYAYTIRLEHQKSMSEKNYDGLQRRLKGNEFIGSAKFYFSELITTNFKNHGNTLPQGIQMVKHTIRFPVMSGLKMREMYGALNLSLKELIEKRRYDCLTYEMFHSFGSNSHNQAYIYLSPKTKQFKVIYSDTPPLDDKELMNSPISITCRRRPSMGPHLRVKNVYVPNMSNPEESLVSSNPRETKTTLYIHKKPFEIARLQQVQNPYDHLHVDQKNSIRELKEQYDKHLSEHIDWYFDALVKNPIPGAQVVYPLSGDQQWLPLHFPINYLEQLKLHSKIQLVLTAEDLSIGSLDYRYQFEKILDDGKFCYQLRLILIYIDSHFEQHELISVTVAQFDTVAVEAYKKIVFTENGYTSIENFNEFLLLTIYGTPKTVGIPAHGSLDISSEPEPRIEAVGTICPIERRFVGLIKILSKTQDQVFHYRHELFTDEVSQFFYEYYGEGTQANIATSTAQFFMARTDACFKIHPGFQRLLTKIVQRNNEFYAGSIQGEKPYQELLSKLYSQYDVLMSSLKLRTGLDGESLALKLADKLDISLPCILEKMASMHFAEFRKQLDSHIANRPKREMIETFLNDLQKYGSRLVSDLNVLRTAVNNWIGADLNTAHPPIPGLQEMRWEYQTDESQAQPRSNASHTPAETGSRQGTTNKCDEVKPPISSFSSTLLSKGPSFFKKDFFKKEYEPFIETLSPSVYNSCVIQ